MTRRKSACLKWTLVLLVVLVCPSVHSRPQETPVTTISGQNEKSTEVPIRYRNRHNNLGFKLAQVVIGLINRTSNVENLTLSNLPAIFDFDPTDTSLVNRAADSETSNKNISSNRVSRLIHASITKKKYKGKPERDKIHEEIVLHERKKPAIKKVITKWRDKTKYDDLHDDLHYSYETTAMPKPTKGMNKYASSYSDDVTTTESIEETNSKRYTLPSFEPQYNMYNKPRPQYSEETHVYSTNIQVVDPNSRPSYQVEEQYQRPTRPPYFHTFAPTPTPVITNVGYPKPWTQNVRRTTTQRPKPTKYEYHNNVNNNHGGNYEVTTFEPTNSYTDRIVIRPEEYSPSAEDCPTIYLTLNNTFQGEGKEACPDLNIAVNTNVINKNVVVESEEDGASLFPGFGLGDDSGIDSSKGEDYLESQENQQAESASVEGTELSNYHSANSPVQAEPEPGGYGAGTSPLSALTKPGRPGSDDDIFSFSSLVDFFRPALNALSWLVTINPFSIGLFPILLAPISFIFAGSGLAALFAPWFLPIGREGPKIIHVYRPEWQWDHQLKTWQLHSFPNSRRGIPEVGRDSSIKEGEDKVMPTLFSRLKSWMVDATNRLKVSQRNRIVSNKPRLKRRRRDTWATRVKSTATQAVSTSPNQPDQLASPAPESSARDVKTKAPIRESFEMVAIQLLDKPNSTIETPIVSDTRIPPKLKTQVKHKLKTRNEDGDVEIGHLGEAVPVTMEELDTENKISEVSNESSTSNEGISTWISLSNSVKDNTTTEPTKVEETSKKPKPIKTKPKRPQNNKISKRPIIGSTNKADLVAGGSAINENVFNKLKDTVLTNVQKNKNNSARVSTTTSTTTTTTTTEASTTKKETKPPAISVVTVTAKPKKKNKNKHKTTTTLATPFIDDSALLPTEAKEQEIELEVSTPPITTKKPKRKSNKKKNKTKKRKTSTPKPSTEVTTIEVKTSNKTKSNKNAKKPAAQTGAITTQIYNYLSREVMPSVGVGVLGLASLVGIAGYFLYPFATPVRRTFEVDKSDDLYRNNAEEYANDGNGQAEEEMLGTVLAGMPAHAKQKLNPYAGQTAHINRYPVKKEQDVRYRHVTPGYNPNYKVHYAQQKTGIAHAAVYSKPAIAYGNQYETRHAYTTEDKYNYEKPKQPNYTTYPAAAVEPIYAAPQTGPSGVSSYGNDAANSVVYGVKPTSESDFKPVYPFEAQFYGETTSSPVTYQPTSMYLGSNNDSENQEENEKLQEEPIITSEDADNKFVVGNVPKELSDSATPAVVPEHGPRKLRKRRSISGSLEELLAEKELNKDIFISNKIDDLYNNAPIRNLAPSDPNDVTVLPKDITTVYAMSEVAKESKTTETPTTERVEVIESVSTIPISSNKGTIVADFPVELETTTKTFKVYEVFPSSNIDSNRNSPLTLPTTTFKSMMTETTTELKSETTSTMPTPEISTIKPRPTYKPEVITYPPLNEQGGFFSFLQRLVDFKLRVGLGILQSTVDALNKFKDDTMQKVAKSSKA